MSKQVQSETECQLYALCVCAILLLASFPAFQLSNGLSRESCWLVSNADAMATWKRPPTLPFDGLSAHSSPALWARTNHKRAPQMPRRHRFATRIIVERVEKGTEKRQKNERERESKEQ